MKNNYNYGSLESFVDIAAPEAVAGRIMPDPAKRLEVEIGFGTGEYLAGLAAAAPDTVFLGFEQCPLRVIKALRKIHQARLGNVRLLRLDASLAFECLLKPSSLDKVHCLFPCPWPKKRHAKHRLFQPEFLALVRHRLKPGGVLRIVTDHHPYADWIEEQLAETGFAAARAMIGAVHGTKFEKKWQAGGQEKFCELLLRADGMMPSLKKEAVALKVFFLDRCDLSRMVLEDVQGPVTVLFAERVVDLQQQTAMIHAIVGEDGRTQHCWVLVSRTEKGWCIGSAPGTAALPTAGVRQAVDRVYQAAAASA